MSHRVTFLLHVRTEQWSHRDHAEINSAFTRAGFIPEGGTWRVLDSGRENPLRFEASIQPSKGRVRFSFRIEDWEDRPQEVARAARDAVAALGDRVDVVHGVGPAAPVPTRRPRALADVTALGAVNVFSADLVADVGAERLHATPGMEVDALPFGAVILRLPFSVVSAEWTPDVEARLLDAEMHLDLALDPSRYPTLSGPAADYRRRMDQTPAE